MTPIDRILIDADGCPVTDIAIEVAKAFSLACIIICDEAHVFDREGAKTITVTRGADSVDFKLLNMATVSDVVITQDYGLAAMCLAKKARVLNQDGKLYDDSNIDGLLAFRHEAKRLRMSGGRLKGKPKRQKEQDVSFKEALVALIQAASK